VSKNGKKKKGSEAGYLGSRKGGNAKRTRTSRRPHDDTSKIEVGMQETWAMWTQQIRAANWEKKKEKRRGGKEKRTRGEV